MKQYNGEKAIISLTTWRARIDTVGLTLFNLIKQCPGFHIVLVLSEEEFPQKEAELPDSVMAFVDQDLIEILWVFKNYRSFKKVLFTMDKYKGLPVISADDDCIYGCNYANKLYDFWQLNYKRNYIYYCSPGEGSGWGYLFPPNIFKSIGIQQLENVYTISPNDDLFYVTLANKMHIPRVCINLKSIIACHDTIEPINIGKEYAINPHKRREDTKLFNKLIKV